MVASKPLIMKWRLPVPDSWDNNRGYRFLDLMKSGTYHPGVDLNDPRGGDSDLGAPINACADGVVEYAQNDGTGFGKHLFIRHTCNDEEIYSHYAHLDAIQVSEGDSVSCGQQVATCGYSGRYSGNWWSSHLHFEIRRPIGKGYNFWPSSWGVDQIKHYYFDPVEFIRDHNSEEVEMTKEEIVQLIKEKIEGKADKNDISPVLEELDGGIQELKDNFQDYQDVATQHREATDESIKTLVEGLKSLREALRAVEENLTNDGSNSGEEVNNSMNTATVESLKELGRVVLFSLVSFGITYLAGLPETSGTLFGLAILRALDKFIHEFGKETNNGNLIKGLSRF